MPVSFCRVSGPYEYDDRAPTKASTVIAVGDALEQDTGLAPAESDDEIHGIALEGRASIADQAPILIMLILDRAKFFGLAETGTFVSTTDGNSYVDLNSADGLAADTNTNHDWYVNYVLSTTAAIGQFTHLANQVR